MIYTIGYGNSDAQSILDDLKKNKVTDLIDVRSIPFSRYRPEFNKKGFAVYLQNNNIKYHWNGKNIGGLKENTYYDETLENIFKTFADNKERSCAIMCSEGDYNKCHRKELASILTKKGTLVYHIFKTNVILHKDDSVQGVIV